MQIGDIRSTELAWGYADGNFTNKMILQPTDAPNLAIC